MGYSCYSYTVIKDLGKASNKQGSALDLEAAGFLPMKVHEPGLLEEALAGTFILGHMTRGSVLNA